MTKKDKKEALDLIAKEIARCGTCKKDKVGLAVPGEGSPNARVVFIGEAPGKEEAKTGRPFVGRAGKILRSLIKEAGLREKDVYITSPVKYLPKHVTPRPKEIEHGRKHLLAQLDIIKPRLVVLLGNVATIALLQEKRAIAKEHGKMLKKDNLVYFLSYHPAAALHAPGIRPRLIKDFKKLKRLIELNGS